MYVPLGCAAFHTPRDTIVLLTRSSEARVLMCYVCLDRGEAVVVASLINVSRSNIQLIHCFLIYNSTEHVNNNSAPQLL